MCEYTGPNDPCRDHEQDLHLQDLLEIMPAYTKVKPVTMDEGLLPFTASKPAPQVSCLASRSHRFPVFSFIFLIVFCLSLAEIQEL